MACQGNENETITLKETVWKLVSFVNVANNEIKEPQPISEKCYLLTFNEGNTLTGFSSSNELVGTYILNNKNLSIHINIHQATLVTEAFDGNPYLEALNTAQSFLLHGDELQLYYNDKKNYLLFKLQKS